LHVGRELPEQILVDQHCLVESFGTGTGGTFTRQRDYITVRLESIKGPGNAWVDYEVPGIVPRQQGPRGQFDPASPAVAFTFPIDQPPAGSSLVIHAGADNDIGQDRHFTLSPPALCGQTSGNSADVELPYGVWSKDVKMQLTQQCVPATDAPHIRWISRVTVVLEVTDLGDSQFHRAAWVDYWLSNSGRPDYQRATQGHFEPDRPTMTLTFDLPAARGGAVELGVIGSFDRGGARMLAAHAWAPLKDCPPHS
jgi:hypothetical protein